MRAVVIALAGLAVGVALGYVFWGARADSGSAEPSVESEVSPDRATTELDAPEELRAAVAALPTPELPHGEGRVTGRITDTDGKPLSNVVVFARRSGPDPMRALIRMIDSRDVAASVVRFVEYWHSYVVTVAETTTNASGEYELSGLADEWYEVWARAEGHEITSANPEQYGHAMPGDIVNLVGVRQYEVRFNVLLPDGSQADCAQLSIDIEDDGVAGQEWTPSHETGSFAVGEYSVAASVWGKDGETHTSDLVSFEVRPDLERPLVVLSLTETGALVGRLMQPGGVALARRDLWISIERLGPGRETGLQPNVDSTYRFRKRLKPGNYSLTVYSYDEPKRKNEVLRAQSFRVDSGGTTKLDIVID